jgi:hypothetical protein
MESSEEHGGLDRARNAIQKNKRKNRADNTEDGTNDLEHDDDSSRMHVRQGAPRPPISGYQPMYNDRHSRRGPSNEEGVTGLTAEVTISPAEVDISTPRRRSNTGGVEITKTTTVIWRRNAGT